MKPSSMLYRNLLAMEVEESVRSQPLDGVIILAACDKSIPGALMGAFSTNVPCLIMVSGPRPSRSSRVDVSAPALTCGECGTSAGAVN